MLFLRQQIGKSLLTSSAKAKLLFAPLISEHGLYRHFNDKGYRADFLGITGNSDYTFSPAIVFNNHIYTGQYSRIVTGICGNNDVFLPLKDSVCYFMELTDTTRITTGDNGAIGIHDIYVKLRILSDLFYKFPGEVFAYHEELPFFYLRCRTDTVLIIAYESAPRCGLRSLTFHRSR